MDARVLELRKKTDLRELSTYVLSLNQDELEELKLFVENANADAAEMVEAVLSALYVMPSFEITEELSTFCMKVFRAGLRELRNGIRSSKVAADLSRTMIVTIKCLDGKALAELADLLIEWVKTEETPGTWIKILPSLIGRLPQIQAQIRYNGWNLSGQEYRDHVIDLLCGISWNAVSAPRMVEIFREIDNLSKEEMQRCIDRVLRLFEELKLEDVPPVAHQLLHLASAKGHEKSVVDGIINFFRDRDAEAVKSENENNLLQLRRVAGTVILHICNAAQMGSSVAKPVMDSLKVTGRKSTLLFNPFGLALAFSLDAVSNCEDLIEFLKKRVLAILKDDEMRNRSCWIRNMDPESIDIKAPLLVAAKFCSIAWDSAYDALREFSLSLLETSHLKKAKTSSTLEVYGQIGADIWIILFKAKASWRKELVCSLLTRVVTGHIGLNQYMALILVLFTDCPGELTSQHRCFEDFLPGWPHQSFSDGCNLFRSVAPLITSLVSFRDSVIAVLRKAIYDRSLDIRKMATAVYFQLLKLFPYDKTSQRVSMGNRGCNPAKDSGNGVICHEIILTFRRALANELATKELLYEGLASTYRINPGIKIDILGIFMDQLFKVFGPVDDPIDSLNLHKCFEVSAGHAVVVEPLNILLRCAAFCIGTTAAVQASLDETVAGPSTNAGGTCREYVRNVFERLTTKLLTAEPSFFGLDSSSHLSASGLIAAKTKLMADLSVGCYEACIEYSFSRPEWNSTEHAERTLTLFKNCKKLRADFQPKKAVAGKKRGPDATKNGTPGPSQYSIVSTQPDENAFAVAPKCSGLSLRFIDQAFSVLFLDHYPEHQQYISHLKDNNDFVAYLYQNLIEKVDELKNRNLDEGYEGMSAGELLSYLRNLIKTMLIEIDHTFQMKKADRKWLETCVAAFVGCVKLIFQHRDEPTMILLVEELDSVGMDHNVSKRSTMVVTQQLPAQVAEEHYSRVRQLVGKMLKFCAKLALSDEIHKKAAISLLDAVDSFSSAVPRESTTEFQQIGFFLHQLFTGRAVEDPAFVKKLLAMFLLKLDQFDCEIESQGGQQPCEIIASLGAAVCAVQDEKEIENHPKCINDKTFSTVILPVLTKHLEEVLDRMEWIAKRITVPVKMEDDAPREDGIYVVLNHVLDVLIKLMKEMPASDYLLKATTKWYTSLLTFVRIYDRGLRDKENRGELSPHLEDLISKVSTKLSIQVYKVITEIHETKKEKGESSTKKKGGHTITSRTKASEKFAREFRPVTSLVFAVEQYEGFLIKFSRTAKIDFLKHAKASVNRDFKITTSALPELDVTISSTQMSHTATAVLGHNDSVQASAAMPPPTSTTRIKNAATLVQKKQKLK